MDLLNKTLKKLVLFLILDLQLSECRGKIRDSEECYTYLLCNFLQGSKEEGRVVTEASAVTWFYIDGEFSVVQPATVKLNPHLMFAIAKQRKEYHLHEVLKPSLDVGLPVIDQT